MKEIGSLFPIYEDPGKTIEPEGKEIPSNEIRLSLCREALLAIAEREACHGNSVMLPAYTCQSVIAPFAQMGWRCRFYGIRKDLRINVGSFLEVLDAENPSIVLVHPYYGLGLSPEEKTLLIHAKESGAIVVEDVTQCIFKDKNENFIGYYVGSYRKWLPIPDGAFLYQTGASEPAAPKTLPENAAFVVSQLKAMRLRGQYFVSNELELKRSSIQLNKAAEKLIDTGPIAPHEISAYSNRALSREDVEVVQARRRENACFLYRRLDRNACDFPIRDAEEMENTPLYLPLYFHNRAEVQRKLAANGVYAPILWPVETPAVLVDDDVRFIYEHILLIPIDQRYDLEDMRRIAAIINGNQSLQ